MASQIILLMIFIQSIEAYLKRVSSWSTTRYWSCNSKLKSEDWLTYYYPLDGEYIIIYEPQFYCNWIQDSIIYSLGSNQQIFYYQSPTSYQPLPELCNQTSSDTLTINFTINYVQKQIHYLQMNNNNGGLAQILFLDMFGKDKCHIKCKTCYDIGENNCSSCYYSNPINGKCPQCPAENPFYNQQNGCLKTCLATYYKYKDGVCQVFQNTIIYSKSVYDSQIYWTNIYDPDYIDTSLKFHFTTHYGIFKHKSGAQKFIQIPSNSYSTLYGIFKKLVGQQKQQLQNQDESLKQHQLDKETSNQTESQLQQELDEKNQQNESLLKSVADLQNDLEKPKEDNRKH